MSGGQGRLKPSPGNFFVASMSSLLPLAIWLAGPLVNCVRVCRAAQRQSLWLLDLKARSPFADLHDAVQREVRENIRCLREDGPLNGELRHGRGRAQANLLLQTRCAKTAAGRNERMDF